VAPRRDVTVKARRLVFRGSLAIAFAVSRTSSAISKVVRIKNLWTHLIAGIPPEAVYAADKVGMAETSTLRLALHKSCAACIL
jgi:hypothetical protein